MKVQPIVHGLEEVYGDRMSFAIRAHHEGDAQELIKKYGLDIHGMVITDRAGAVRWKESSHNQTRAGVEAAIQKLLDEG